jgi:hypothetical protein
VSTDSPAKSRLFSEELIRSVPYSVERVAHAIEDLVEDGRAQERDGALFGGTMRLPVGTAAGLEAAVFDHYQAVCMAVAQKIRRGIGSSSAEEIVGGATLGFDLSPDNPRTDRVTSLVGRLHADMNELWDGFVSRTTRTLRIRARRRAWCSTSAST